MSHAFSPTTSDIFGKMRFGTCECARFPDGRTGAPRKLMSSWGIVEMGLCAYFGEMGVVGSADLISWAFKYAWIWVFVGLVVTVGSSE